MESAIPPLQASDPFYIPQSQTRDTAVSADFIPAVDLTQIPVYTPSQPTQNENISSASPVDSDPLLAVISSPDVSGVTAEISADPLGAVSPSFVPE